MKVLKGADKIRGKTFPIHIFRKHIENLVCARPWVKLRILRWIRYSQDLGPGREAAKLLQSCPTLCHPIDGSPQGSPVPGILQGRILEWVAISSSNT